MTPKILYALQLGLELRHKIIQNFKELLEISMKLCPLQAYTWITSNPSSMRIWIPKLVTLLLKIFKIQR